MNNKKTLLILAAGQGSRYGGNKQTEWFGPNQEMIMDYSIHDAIEAGFNKIVFVIRQDFFEQFKIAVEGRWKNKAELHYTFQSKDKFCLSEKDYQKREKPWGTAHAVLCANEIINEPFLMINSDDFYGKESFTIASKFLETECLEKQYGLIAYQLNKTVSKYGTVSRGICKINKEGYLENIREHTKIIIKDDKIISQQTHNNNQEELDKNTKVSMNFFCFHPSIFKALKTEFHKFLETEAINNSKAEFLIPTVVDNCMKEKDMKILTKNTNEKWFGVTYKEDAEIVIKEIKKLIEKKMYPEKFVKFCFQCFKNRRMKTKEIHRHFCVFI